MAKTFVCSLCRSGLLGGGLYLDEKYRNLILPLREIKEITWKRIVFPVAAVNMENGETYRFLIFIQKRFEKYFQEYWQKSKLS